MYAASRMSSMRNVLTLSSSVKLFFRNPVQRPTVFVRCISAKEIFQLDKLSTSLTDIPPVPSPPLPRPSIDELISAGQSVVDELGLYTWWKPTSYVRLALEYAHNNFDLPWWGAIVGATICLRLAMIYVPIMSQRLVQQRNLYKNEFDDFRERMMEARKEGNNMLAQQIYLEQRDFCLSKGIRNGRMFLVLTANAIIFSVQFFSIRKMVEVNFPGWSTGGALWFTDLTASDPYFILPALSATSIALVTRLGIETGSSTENMANFARVGMQYGIPVFVFICTSQFASGLCVYWCTSNLMSLLYAGVFRIPAVRDFLGIAAVAGGHKPKPKGGFMKMFSDYKETKAAPPSIFELAKKDMEQFRRAGRGKRIQS